MISLIIHSEKIRKPFGGLEMRHETQIDSVIKSSTILSIASHRIHTCSIANIINILIARFDNVKIICSVFRIVDNKNKHFFFLLKSGQNEHNMKKGTHTKKQQAAIV